MTSWGRYTYILRWFIYLAILIDIVSRNTGNIWGMILYTGLFILVIINDYIRLNHYNKLSAKTYHISIITSILLSSYINILLGGYVNIHLFILLFDIGFVKDKRVVRYLYVFNLFMIIGLPAIYIASLEGISILQIIRADIVNFLMVLAYFFFTTSSIFSYRALILEKQRVEELNKKIEELTISKERSRLAQEIHDNLGHNLVALNMNLDVASKILDQDIDQVRELIDKCQNLSQDSMDSLRRAVYALREESAEGLLETLEKLAYNIENENKLKINYKIDRQVEEFPLEFKNLIYTSIKEAITNSIKHGKSSEININLNMEDGIRLEIKDDGKGCGQIIEGNGLGGIKERARKFNGQLICKSEEGQGFELSLFVERIRR